MRILVLLLTLLWSTTAAAVPVDEIRRVLSQQALQVPPAELLAAMTEDNLPDLLRQFDPYARIFSSQDYAPTGTAPWIGIGAALAMRGEQPVLHIYRGGGAQLAGVPDRSRLVAIDERKIVGQSAEDIAALLRGEPGSEVHLQVITPAGNEQNFTVRREVFAPLDVELLDAAPRRVIRIREFTAGLTRPALCATLEFPARPAADEVLILDLRDAPGGDLYEAFDLAGLFLPQGTLLGTIRDRHGVTLEIRAPSGPKISNPMALLTGPETASAAEIFAGILRRHDRVRLVGQRTFGKCTSQTDVCLSDGSILRYTNREVVLPNGESCPAHGLEPDLQVSNATLDRLNELAERAYNLLTQSSEQ